MTEAKRKKDQNGDKKLKALIEAALLSIDCQ